MLGTFSSQAAPTKVYTNTVYGFSLRMPATFTATEGTGIDPAASTTILLQNSAADGVQINISPWDEPASALTSARITKDTGLTVKDPQPIALNGATGLTFESNNPAFNGASSEAWFIAGGNIYQMSTYAAECVRERLWPLCSRNSGLRRPNQRPTTSSVNCLQRHLRGAGCDR